MTIAEKKSTPSHSLHRFAFGAACMLFATAATPALACNPFELLFGGCRETQAFRPAPRYYEPYQKAAPVRRAPRLATRTEKAKVVHAAAMSSNGVSGKQKPMVATPDARMGSLALFEKDKTLRAGDAVVTNDGILIYGGSRNAFSPVAKNGSALSALQQASFKPNDTTVSNVWFDPKTNSVVGLRQAAVQQSRSLNTVAAN